MRIETIKVLNRNTRLPQQPMVHPGRAARMLLGYLVVVFSGLPLAHAASNSLIWEDGDQIVQLARQDDHSASPNDHPINTTPSEIAAMLKTLRLRFADEEPDSDSISVFTQEELDNLGSAIATGLGRATPSQDVIFHVIGTRRLSPGAFTKRNRVSAGRVFYRGGHLNIIFGQVQTPYRKKNIYGQTDQDFYPRNYGSRKKATQHDTVLLGNDAVSLTRNDWVIIEPGAAAVTATARAQPADDKPDPTPPPASSAALAAAPASSTDTAKEQAGGTSAQSIRSTENVEERLEALKRLRERELISEEAYQAKMKEILQDL
jgi:hypothetical protein